MSNPAVHYLFAVGDRTVRHCGGLANYLRLDTSVQMARKPKRVPPGWVSIYRVEASDEDLAVLLEALEGEPHGPAWNPTHVVAQRAEDLGLGEQVRLNRYIDELRKATASDHLDPPKGADLFALADDLWRRMHPPGSAGPAQDTAPTIESPDALVPPAAPVPVKKLVPDAMLGTRKGRRMKWLSEAMILVRDRPNWPDAEIAQQVGKNPGTLSRSKEYQIAAAEARGQPIAGHVRSGEDAGGNKTAALDGAGDAPDLCAPASRTGPTVEDTDARIDREDRERRLRNGERNVKAGKRQ